MRIGEQLVADNLVAEADVEMAARDQARTGLRLASLLVRRGMIDIDDAARALARVHGVPAALQRHLEGRDPSLAELIPAALAHRHGVIPVARTRDGALVVCMRDPARQEAIHAIEEVTRIGLVPAVACQYLVDRVLVQIYGPAAAEAMDGSESDFDVDLHTGPIDVPNDFAALSDPMFTLVDLDDSRVTKDHTQSGVFTSQTGADPTRLSGSNKPLAAPAPVAASSTGPRTAIPIPPIEARTLASAPTPDLRQAKAMLAQASSRDAVTDGAFEYLRGAWSVALMFTIKDGAAMGHRGIGAQLTPAAVDAIVLPLTSPSFIKTVVDTARPFSPNLEGDGREHGAIQERLLRLLGHPGQVDVVPIAVAGKLISVLVAAGAKTAAARAELAELATAIGEAYVRAIRTAKRG